ncbi:hypothetical protein DPM19_33440 [Actinomadura craniellae]|uniref:Uncharacterized protein n=1 Tax=Actinomadura craniellae TaxID=2231787 RepID=A0A365GVM9_9ACTN|nr:hypothetical protein [Actinomadura craniellae]RAY10866.1 hypothetical protein DPM19_33440 [Actinomadura craniellae]
MPKTLMIADFLRSAARRRIDLVEDDEEGRNARCAVALINAAGYVQEISDTDRVVTRMAAAGCFEEERFRPTPTGERLITGWHYTGPGGDPADLLAAVAAAAERETEPIPAVLPQPRAATG